MSDMLDGATTRRDGDTHSQTVVLHLELHQLRPMTDQPRSHFPQEELRQLGDSMRAHGQQVPLSVRKLTDEERAENPPAHANAEFEIVGGERRFRAAQLVGIGLLKAIENDVPRDKRYTIAYVDNEQRADLTPLEHSRALNRILENDCGGNVAELVRLIGKSRGWVDQHLCLTKLHSAVQELLDPARTEKQRLQLKVAVYLHQACTQEQQERFAREYNASLGADQLILWVQDHILGGRTGSMSGTVAARGVLKRPDKVRERIINTVRAIEERLALATALSDDAMDQVAKGMSFEELDELTQAAEAVQENMTAFIEQLRGAYHRKQLTRGGHLIGDRDDMVCVDYRDPATGIVERARAVSLSRYHELGRAGELLFQIQGRPKPSHLPDLDG